MINYVKIKSFALLRRSTNAIYLVFMSLISAIIAKFTPEKLGLADTYAVFVKQNTLLQDIVKRSFRAAQTPEMQELDVQRSSLFMYIRNAINNARTSPVATHQNAYKVLLTDYAPYSKSGFNRFSTITKTAVLSGFVLDMKKPVNLEQIKVLYLDAALTELESKNAAYETLIGSRNSYLVKEDLGTSKALRLKTDDIYELMKDNVNAKLVLEPTDEIKSCVLEWNRTIDEITARINQCRAQGTNKKKEKSDVNKDVKKDETTSTTDPKTPTQTEETTPTEKTETTDTPVESKPVATP